MVLVEQLVFSLSSVIGWFDLSFVGQIGGFEVRLLLVKLKSVC